MATVQVTAVKKTYGKTEIIHGVDLDIADGDFVVIVGPSGCGKSTLLRMIAGLEKITEGEIAIAGKCVNELEPMERNIAMVFQNYALYPHMSVFQNLAYGLKIAKVPTAEINERVQHAAKLLQLDNLLERKPKDLSGGQRQRVAMGRAIVRKPAVFLFDEPLSNLDARLRSQMRLEIKSLQKKLGITSIYVTHDQVEAMTLADWIVVMNAGKIEQISRPDEIYNRPQTRFVGGFMGAPPMNFIVAKMFTASQLRTFGLSQNQCQDDTLTIGIRPEKITLHNQTNAEGKSVQLQGTVIFNEPLGAHTIVHLKLSSDDIITVLQNGTDVPPPNSQANLVFDKTAIHLFNQNGKRIE